MIVRNLFLVTVFLLPYMSDAAASSVQGGFSDAKNILIVHMKKHKEWYYQNMGEELEKVDDHVLFKYVRSIMSVAVMQDDRPGVDLLLALPGEVSEWVRKDGICMRLAAYYGRLEIAQTLHGDGFSVDAISHRVDSPLENAVQNSHDETVAWLIGKGADVHGLGRTSHILTYAIRSSDNIFDALLRAGASLDDPRLKGSLLHNAMGTKNFYKVNLLLVHGYDPNAQDEKGCTPLLLAVKNQQSIETIDLLLNAGASPHIASYDGLRPIYEAARLNNAEVFERLLICELSL